MALIYADFCTSCGKRRTRHPSGLCCRCRKRSPRMSCVICGSKAKVGEYCYECRRRLKVSKDLETAIDEQQQRLHILELRKSGMTFDKISDAVGLSKSTVHRVYRDMMRLPNDISLEATDILENMELEAN